MNDATFRKQVEADAVANGWTPDLAAALARMVGRPAPAAPKARGPVVGKAPKITNHPREIAGLLRVLGLRASLQSDLSAAGYTTFAAVRRVLHPAVTCPNPRAAVEALGLSLLTRRLKSP